MSSTTKALPLGRAATITDIAARAGLSKSTVSLVLQGSPLIKPETQQRVREAALELGYVYNRRAAGLRSGASNTVGVIINDLMNPFFAELLVGIERRLVEAGYVVLMAHTAERLDVQERVLASMREHNAAGLIVCPALGSTGRFLQDLKGWGIPLLVVVRDLKAQAHDFVGSDNEEGTRLATDHLLGLGHRRIAFVGGRAGTVVHEQRVAGYERALRRARLRVDRTLIVESELTRAGGVEAMAAIRALDPPPTAAVCYNDIVALGLMAAAAAQGLKVGQDFSIVGFDGIVDAEHAFPPLATIDIRPGELGERAAEALLARIETPGAPVAKQLAKPVLVDRASAGPAPG